MTLGAGEMSFSVPPLGVSAVFMARQCMIILLLLSLGYCYGIYDGNDWWYRGCFKKSSNSSHTRSKVSLAVCSAKCLAERFSFIALQHDICVCLQEIRDMEAVAVSNCDTSCSNVEDTVLQCGSKQLDTWSVYTAQGPHLGNVDLETAEWIEPNIPTTLKATVFISAFVDVGTEPLVESEWENTVEFLWQTEFTTVGVNISANSSQEQAVCTLTFPNTGNFSIELQVRNLVSRLKKNFTVTVVPPKPRVLQVTPAHDRLPHHHAYPQMYTLKFQMWTV